MNLAFWCRISVGVRLSPGYPEAKEKSLAGKRREKKEEEMYRVVKGSRGEARCFSVTVGLKEGYGESSTVHTVEEAVSYLENYLKMRAANGEPFLTGVVSEGIVVYAWPEGPGQAESGHEAEIIFSGEVTPLYLSNLSDTEVENFLNDLASFLGEKLGQTRIYLRYKSEVWILQREDSETPTGETV
jgi:hypothetical protein